MNTLFALRVDSALVCACLLTDSIEPHLTPFESTLSKAALTEYITESCVVSIAHVKFMEPEHNMLSRYCLYRAAVAAPRKRVCS